MKLRQIFSSLLLCIISAFFTLWAYDKYSGRPPVVQIHDSHEAGAAYAGFRDRTGRTMHVDDGDFTEAAEIALPAVVHIRAKIKKRTDENQQQQKRSDVENMFEHFFGISPNVVPEQRASGSGVIVTDDGYIVTNNHVIVSDMDGKVAEEIIVTLSDATTHTAKLIGRDPDTDIALLKIDANKLSYINFGNSDQIKTGQWVLAVGYPIGLEVTATAGIISGKGRRIGINSRLSSTPVEDFIQTDAAINSGNSGGALVTMDGRLAGINSAMLSVNGGYNGYSFSIPANLVKKVISGLIKNSGAKVSTRMTQLLAV